MAGTEQAVLEQRMASVETKLAELGFDALAVYARGSGSAFGSKSHGYMRYLRDWDTYYSPGVVLVLAPGRPRTLITSDIFLKKLTEQHLFPGEAIVYSPLPDMAGTVLRILGDLAAAGGRPVTRLAWLGRSETPAPFWETLKEGLHPGAEIRDFEEHLAMDLAVKDAGQLALHREAAAICDAMYEELDRLVPRGLSAWHLRSAMEKTARDAGAEHCLIWLTVAPVAESCHFYREDSARVPQPGDQVLCGIYTLYRGHWGHGIRMGSYGEATPAMLRAYDTVREMQEAALAALVPGSNLYAVNQAFEAVFARRFPGPREDIFRFRAAHGLGHFSEDPLTTDPFQHAYAPAVPVPPDAFLEILPGMLFELHPNYFQAGVAGAALGDMVYVGNNGPELLLRFPREFRNWGGAEGS